MTYVYDVKADTIIETIVRVAHGLNYSPYQSDHDRLAFMVTDEEWRVLCQYVTASTPYRPGVNEMTIAGLRVRRFSDNGGEKQ